MDPDATLGAGERPVRLREVSARSMLVREAPRGRRATLELLEAAAAGAGIGPTGPSELRLTGSDCVVCVPVGRPPAESLSEGDVAREAARLWACAVRHDDRTETVAEALAEITHWMDRAGHPRRGLRHAVVYLAGGPGDDDAVIEVRVPVAGARPQVAF